MRVLMFALTSGTTASRKLIPVTDAYLAAYRRGWATSDRRASAGHFPSYSGVDSARRSSE